MIFLRYFSSSVKPSSVPVRFKSEQFLDNYSIGQDLILALLLSGIAHVESVNEKEAFIFIKAEDKKNFESIYPLLSKLVKSEKLNKDSEIIFKSFPSSDFYFYYQLYNYLSEVKQEKLESWLPDDIKAMLVEFHDCLNSQVLALWYFLSLLLHPKIDKTFAEGIFFISNPKFNPKIIEEIFDTQFSLASEFHGTYGDEKWLAFEIFNGDAAQFIHHICKDSDWLEWTPFLTDFNKDFFQLVQTSISNFNKLED